MYPLSMESEQRLAANGLVINFGCSYGNAMVLFHLSIYQPIDSYLFFNLLLFTFFLFEQNLKKNPYLWEMD